MRPPNVAKHARIALLSTLCTKKEKTERIRDSKVVCRDGFSEHRALSLPRWWHQLSPVHSTSLSEQANRQYAVPFKFIFGVSTGHAGSTTAQNTTLRDGCPFNPVGAFEYTDLHELDWKVRVDRNRTCQRVNATLIPRLNQFIPRKTKYWWTWVITTIAVPCWNAWLICFRTRQCLFVYDEIDMILP